MGLRRGGGGRCFQKGEVRVACLMETKLNGKGEVSQCRVNGITAGFCFSGDGKS